MSWYLRWRNVFRSKRLDDELENEFEYHLAETVDRLVAGGMPEKEALREARRRLGNYAMQKERTRDMNVAAWLDATRADRNPAAWSCGSSGGIRCGHKPDGDLRRRQQW